MGNCMASNIVTSQEVEDDCHLPFGENMKATISTALKQTSSEDSGERNKSKTEKKVRFKLEDYEEGGEGGDLGNGNGAMRRVRVVVTKEELRQILRHTKGSRHSSSSSSSCSLEELVVALRSRNEGRINNGLGGNYWRPGLESIPEYNKLVWRRFL